MISFLKIDKPFRLVSTPEQLSELLEEVQAGAISSQTVLVDAGVLAPAKRSASKVNALLTYLLAIHRKLDLSLILVGDKELHLDKRARLQLTHTSQLVTERYKT